MLKIRSYGFDQIDLIKNLVYFNFSWRKSKKIFLF